MDSESRLDFLLELAYFEVFFSEPVSKFWASKTIFKLPSLFFTLPEITRMLRG